MNINDRIDYLEKQVRGLRAVIKRIESKIDLIDEKITANNKPNSPSVQSTLPPVTDGLTDTPLGCIGCSNYNQYPFGCIKCPRKR
jgi:hypothetical protein